ncbi:MAG: hypothetical protein M1820_003945 [Bogoriella megaspora]|nr:MAG: hypothetical protein M1820_003945 [Bogoriella megaspora]
MPHAENDTMNRPMTNGETPHSQFLDHLTSYPVANDLITTYKNNSLGKKSLDLANGAYDNFAKPVLPYLQGPWTFIAPYVAKADSIADSGLGKVDSHFPIVKEDTEKIKGTVLDYAYFPFHLAGQTKDYVFYTYNDEHKKTKGPDGLSKTAQAVISTELKLMLDVINKVKEFLGPKKEAAEKKAELTKENIEKKVDEMSHKAELTKEDIRKQIDEMNKNASRELEN